MKTLALFNNKGGVGKTSLAYHLGYMFAELGHRVVLADLDPQANLSSMCLDDDRVEDLWGRKQTIYGAIERVKRGIGDIVSIQDVEVTSRIHVVPGDLRLSEFEDDLSQVWPKCLDRDERAFLVTTSLYRALVVSAVHSRAGLAILDVGPNFGAVNRAALLAADYVLVPVAPDLFSMQGLENVGPRLKEWRRQWKERKEKAQKLEFELPGGEMTPLGYAISRHSVLAGGAVKSYQRWIDRMPAAYRTAFDENPAADDITVAKDPFCLAQLKDYRSLMPMAQEAKKPMFLLRPADGAIGGHQAAVRQAYEDFRNLAVAILNNMGIEKTLVMQF